MTFYLKCYCHCLLGGKLKFMQIVNIVVGKKLCQVFQRNVRFEVS